ncbi:cytochrome c biogenesis CcdA family protein [Janibacter corallicola]|uniref:cytochrome c biogenesis CcdA family protein n=1 Tax=Janibacter corallicola TaxID=415212 RepID=UPI00082A106B|nr:cytochrome c biogenesis CcdA family protein [Janibacter corallicola]
MDIGYTGAFLGGILTLLSPCSVMLLPAFFAYAFSSPAKLIGRTVIFYAGLSVTLVPLGVFSGSLGSLLTTHRMTLVTVAAAVVILLGLWQLSGLPVPGLSRTSGGGDATSVGSVFALGAVYAVAGVCAGPILGSVLMVAALGGNAVYGGIVLALYALGMTVPLFVLAAVWKRIGTRGRVLVAPKEVRVGPWRNTWTMVVSGLLSIAIGVLLILTEGTASLGGFFTIGTQQAAESSLATWSESIPDGWFVVAVVVVVGGAFAWRSLRGRSEHARGDSTASQEPTAAGRDR